MSRLRLTLTRTFAFLVISASLASVPASGALAAHAEASPHSVFATARAAVAKRADATKDIEAARAQIAAAKAALAESNGKVLTPQLRFWLGDLLAALEVRVHNAANEVLVAYLAVSPSDFASADGLPAATAGVTASVSAVKLDEQRYAAKVAADAAAARAAAARAAAATRVPRAVVSVASTGIRTINVWTSGFQTQINACRGAVNVTGNYGVPTIAEHWACGGSSFPGAGATIRVTGQFAGVYRVGGVVAVLNAYTADSSQIPRGYQLLFQTCRNGDSRLTVFVALTRIG
jgi:hypothetical protein